MSNLLPREALRAVRNGHRARFIFIGALIAIVCGAIAILALLPAYLFVTSEQPVGSSAAETTPMPSSSDRQDLMRARALVQELMVVASSTTPIPALLEEVLSVRPAGLVITSIRVKRGAPGEIVLSGTTPSRNELNTFREALSKNTRFESVAIPVPIGILTGRTGGTFSATLVGTI